MCLIAALALALTYLYQIRIEGQIDLKDAPGNASITREASNGIAHIEALGVSLIVDYLPFSASSSLIHEPFTRMNFVQQVGNMATGGEGLNYDYSIPTTAVIVCIAYTIIFSFASYLLVKKRDL